MHIVVRVKKIWGKELFYPESDDARFIANLIGKPTIMKFQLKSCVEKGWNVFVLPEKSSLTSYCNNLGQMEK